VIVLDDYSPMVEQGELEAASGLRARLRRRQELAPVSSGFERVLLAEDGSPLLGNDPLTPGEKRYTRARSWVRVDTGHHRLEYRVGISDPGGSADFLATIAVEATIVDAIEAVRHGASSVKDSLEPTLRRAVVDAGESGETVTDSNRHAALTSMRRNARAQIGELEGQKLKGLPVWLSATILSTTVDFDEKTKRHYEQLVELAQQGQVIEATSENDQKRTKGEITVRGLWREDLLPHLSNPSRRVFEQVMANPTDENIATAVRQADERELILLQEVINAFQMAAKEGFVEKDDPTIRALAGFVGRLPQIISGGEPGLAEGEARKTIDADARPGDKHDTIDADPVPGPEEQTGDRDFSD
jgi:hypothetical protein